MTILITYYKCFNHFPIFVFDLFFLHFTENRFKINLRDIEIVSILLKALDLEDEHINLRY